MTLKFEQFDNQFGARIHGLHEDRIIGQQLVEELAAGLTEHGVLLMRGGEISPRRLVELGRAFGQLEILPEPDKRHPDHPEIFDLTNVRKDGAVVDFEEPQAVFLRGTERWHTDSSFRKVPCLCTMLYAVEVPDAGGETQFANMYAALEQLPDDLRYVVNGKRLIHSYVYSRANNPGRMDPMSPEEEAKYPAVSHPWVRTHKDGRQSLYMGGHVSHVEGMDLDEGRELVEEVLVAATKSEFVYEHHWAENDLVIWDNRSTLHRLRPYEISARRRIMRRVTVAGVDPVR
tara:strand:+ start:1952 stop:2815 length:864 start_codon:yes stop_codon:yes gene_type:complete